MFRIRKEFHFSASHCLNGLPKEHPCSNMHGHNYVVTVELSTGELNEVGFVTDYRALEPIKKYIDETLDHKHLNDIMMYNPTAENIAFHLFSLFMCEFPQISAIEVSETPKTTARYEP